ncbi:MAG: hypothetical protein HRU09_14605 [Oligoflexales bacterium]|nr:hypothetical protein [Oligoflexales bacterium]
MIKRLLNLISLFCLSLSMTFFYACGGDSSSGVDPVSGESADSTNDALST